MKKEIKIATYNPAVDYSGPHFFVLNKGMNSGKPAYQPFANSYVILCEDQDIIDDLYWLCWGLWQAKAFRYFLIGSVIQFIRIDVIKKFVIDTYEANKERDIRNITQVMQACNNKIQNCYKQVKLLHQYKLSLFRERIRLPKSSGM
jgi:hypothetical protein